MPDISINTYIDARSHDESFPPDYPRVYCEIDGRFYIEVTKGDADIPGDPCEIEVRQFDGIGGVGVASVRPSREGLESLVQSLLAELHRMNGL
jgi:hypothetical protein